MGLEMLFYFVIVYCLYGNWENGMGYNCDNYNNNCSWIIYVIK